MSTQQKDNPHGEGLADHSYAYGTCIVCMSCFGGNPFLQPRKGTFRHHAVIRVDEFSL